MILLPKELEKTLPALYETQNIKLEEKIVYLKFFTPDANWSWFVIEYDIKDKVFFGYVEGLVGELGYFSLAELKEVRGPLGLKVERDIYFKPKKFKEINKN